MTFIERDYFFQIQNKAYEDDISDLRDQLSSALEHQTTKSVGSLGSDDFRHTEHHHSKVSFFGKHKINN